LLPGHTLPQPQLRSATTPIQATTTIAGHSKGASQGTIRAVGPAALPGWLLQWGSVRMAGSPAPLIVVLCKGGSIKNCPYSGFFIKKTNLNSKLTIEYNTEFTFKFKSDHHRYRYIHLQTYKHSLNHHYKPQFQSFTSPIHKVRHYIAIIS
jgi:hypothetical protein